MIYVYNRTKETHEGPNNYYIGRPSILGNPYSHIKGETLASFVVKTREEAIDQYNHYFDVMYNGNIQFKKLIDEIYEKYKNGIDVYLECYCTPLRCHGDIIKEKLQKRLIKEKIRRKKEINSI
jgi:exoribonuclease II